jgi:hypothetical protein
MVVDWTVATLSLGGCFLAGLVVSVLTKWPIWVTAIAVSITAMVVGAILRPVVLEFGTAIGAFLPALAGAALGSFIHRKRAA